MSSWLLIIFVIILSVTFGEFPSRFLKYSFYMCIHSSCLAAFSLALEVFLLLTSFTVYHAIRDYLSSIKFLILLIWPSMYFICSFDYALIISLCAFFSFWAFTFVGFLLLHRDAVLTFSRFFSLTASVSHGTLCLTLSLVGMHSATAFIWALKFSYSSFGVSVSDISWRVSNYCSCCVIPKTLKMVLDTFLLNTQQYKVRMKGKVEQSRERSSILPYTSV